MNYIDVTYPINSELLIYPGDPIFEKSSFLSIANGDLCNVGKISMGCHTGTHMDAPYHFMADGQTIEQVDLTRLNGPARVIVYEGPLAQSRDISLEFLKSCHIKPGERLIFKTANSQRFAGLNLLEDYTAIDAEAAAYLADLNPQCIGIDYLTVEPADSTAGRVHKTLLGAGIPLLETLDLRTPTPGTYNLHCLPLKLEGMDGSPVRVLLEIK